MSTPDPTTQSTSPAPAQPLAGKGSMGIGILVAWACLIGGYVAIGVVVTALGQMSSALAAIVGPLLLIAPWIAMLVFALLYAGKGQSRTALGIGVGFASIIGVALLLVAACFGLMSGTKFH